MGTRYWLLGAWFEVRRLELGGSEFRVQSYNLWVNRQ
jgi:hypothetical protein